MSRGPGRIQRALISVFEANLSAVLGADEIVEIGFPQVCHEDRHRNAALRAARTLAQGVRFEVFRGSKKAGGMILVSAIDRRSLGIGKVFERFAGTKTVAECTAILDDPLSEAYPEAQVDGFFDLLARRNGLWAEWRDEEAEMLSVRIRERVAEAQLTIAAPANSQTEGASA